MVTTQHYYLLENVGLDYNISGDFRT